MKLKTYAYSMVAASMLLGAVSTQAALVYDGWELDTSGAGLTSDTTGIGNLSLSGGNATVNQQVNGSGNPFVGAQFNEFGEIFSISYIPENCTGACDSGLGHNLNNNLDLQLVFSGLSGTVTSFNSGTGALSYAFTPGTGTVTLQGSLNGGSTWTDLAGLTVADGAGSLNNFFGVAGTTGASSIDGLFLSLVSPDLFQDSGGNNLGGMVAGGSLLLAVQTTNKISHPATASGACSFDSTKTCATLTVQSDGSANLARVPEPSVIGLLGIGLLGMGLAKRRRKA